MTDTTDTLRHVRLEATINHPFTLRTWDTHRIEPLGKTILGYCLSDANGPIFEGEDFACSPLDAIDSDDCLRSLLGFLTLSSGDADAEYFADYSARQMEFAEQDAEWLAVYTETDESSEHGAVPFEDIA